MKCVLFLSVCLLLVLCAIHQCTGIEWDHKKYRQHFYRVSPEPHHKSRPVRETPAYKYEFESYNDIHPPNERQHKYQKNQDEKVLSRDASHKCLDYCRKCGSSYGNSYVCAEDVGYHKPPYTFMLFSNKCQMKCYNKCHNTNYRYSTNALCQKVMTVLESEETAPKHPIRHERHHVWVNSQKTFDNNKH
ncbi:hypothetical protein M8J76_008966 [Diaphorina citri]|nr:hypothetical protein M8J75_001513 [Diaphorina citri]KAI5740957.1 hypothetical protein M8J76_008966 [Diaphorina citri]KAI5747810.1 hypothetical protein M8J77_018724 [Diaphorina citri]